MVNGEIVKEYLEQFKDSPSLTLARLIYEENKECFSSVENVRTVIRHYRGAHGGPAKKGLADRRFIREFDKSLFNPFGIPESDEKEYLPFVLPEKNNKILILSDVHIPYHSVSSVNIALQYGKDHDINTILLNGDILDFHQISFFVKDPRNRHFKDELDMLRRFLDVLDKEFPSATIYYKQGNHEERLETYLKVKAPELYGIPDFELNRLCRFEERGITYIKERRIIKAGKLNILHGHELRGGIIQPVNPARGIFLRTGVSTIVGHWHRTSQHTDPNLDKELISCWSNGCLCELSPDWSPNNKWNHGAAIASINEDGSFNVDNFMIYNNKIYDSAGL